MKTTKYAQVAQELNSILENEHQITLKMSTIACVLKQAFDEIFWVGFYVMHKGALVVGAYQGTLGCLHIPLSKGVCGRAARLQTPQLVADVHADPEHIACDARTQSEVVIPVFNAQKQLIAVLDVDSCLPAYFDETDVLHLSQILSTHFEQDESLEMGYSA